MKRKLVTIVTTTYNRADYLTKLYTSLCNQTSDNFVWYIVDDGSIDNTKSLVDKLKKTSNFIIEYFYKKNGGKNRAVNYVLPLIKTKLLLIVDSDDILSNDSIDQISKDWAKYSKYEIGSMIYQRSDNDLHPLKKIKNYFFGYRYYELIKRHAYGDYSDVFVTKCLKKFKFPSIKGEKFISEGPLYYQFSQVYKSIFIPKTIIIGGYIKNGLTKNIRKLQINNYKGTLYETNLYLKRDTLFYFRLKKSILYDYISIGCKEKTFKCLSRSSNKVLTYSVLPISTLIYLYDKKC